MKRKFLLPLVIELDDENEDLQGDELELTVDQLHAAFAPHVISDSVLVGWGMPSVVVKLPNYADVLEIVEGKTAIAGTNYLDTR